MIQPRPPNSKRVAIDNRASASDGDSRSRPWQRILQNAVRDWRELAGVLELPSGALDRLVDERPEFELVAPRGFIAKIRKGDLQDPLLLQILPQRRETLAVTGYSTDPLLEQRGEHPGVLRKFPGRALLLTTGACPIHCRYCFRRHFPYSSNLASRNNWRAAVDRVASDSSVSEVVLSGGDPLSLSDRALSSLLRQLDTIETVETVRIHTRFPVVIPERVDPFLLESLHDFQRKLVVVLHVNHANEIDDRFIEAMHQLRERTDFLLNQTVLLRNVNDSSTALTTLSRRLFDAHIMPYYIHLLDKVAGTAHFDIDEKTAVQLLKAAAEELPGYLVPRLVREVPGALSKVLI